MAKTKAQIQEELVAARAELAELRAAANESAPASTGDGTEPSVDWEATAISRGAELAALRRENQHHRIKARMEDGAESRETPQESADRLHEERVVENPVLRETEDFWITKEIAAGCLYHLVQARESRTGDTSDPDVQRRLVRTAFALSEEFRRHAFDRFGQCIERGLSEAYPGGEEEANDSQEEG